MYYTKIGIRPKRLPLEGSLIRPFGAPSPKGEGNAVRRGNKLGKEVK